MATDWLRQAPGRPPAACGDRRRVIVDRAISRARPPRQAHLGMDAHRPMLSPARVEMIRCSHERAYLESKADSAREQVSDYLGVRIVVPPEVMPITPMSHLLGDAVLADVRPAERVLDVGTGSGVNAILAATRGAHPLVRALVQLSAAHCAPRGRFAGSTLTPITDTPITVNSIDGVHTVVTETGENGSIQHPLLTPPTPRPRKQC